MPSHPVVTCVLNTATQRFHPVILVESCLFDGDGPVCYRSMVHHTEGFASKAEAQQYVHEDITPGLPGACLDLETVSEWDGQGVPRLVRCAPAV